MTLQNKILANISQYKWNMKQDKLYKMYKDAWNEAEFGPSQGGLSLATLGTLNVIGGRGEL